MEKVEIMGPYLDKEKKKISDRNYGILHREEIRERSREWNKVNRDRKIKQSKVYYQKVKNDPDRISLIRTKARIRALTKTYASYGMTLEEAEMLKSKGCEICGGSQRMVIDHDHNSGKFRGVLCSRCNVNIGRFEKDKSTLNRLIGYLKRLVVS